MFIPKRRSISMSEIRLLCPNLPCINMLREINKKASHLLNDSRSDFAIKIGNNAFIL